MNRGSAAWLGSPAAPFASFNEAPIHESGKSGLELKLRVSVRVASMRPRFMNRGSATRRLKASDLRALQ